MSSPRTHHSHRGNNYAQLPPPSQQQQPQPPPVNNKNKQIMHASHFPSKIVLDDLMMTQGTLRNEVQRNDETVQAVRQENIMLAEKVQHATNLYRQLLGRVSKTEERLASESNSMASIVNQAKQVESLLTTQNEKMQTREQKLAMQVQRLQEEMSILKGERESSRKSTSQLQQEVRSLNEKLSRQSTALATGLQDLKAHLDNKDLERTNQYDSRLHEVVQKISDFQNQRQINHIQSEGRLETLHAQISQTEKARQEDVYKLSTLVREKEAVSKADARTLQDRTKQLLEDFGKGATHRDQQLRSHIESKIADFDRRLKGEVQILKEEFKEVQEDSEKHNNYVKEYINEELGRITDTFQSSKYDNSEDKKRIKEVEKKIDQNRKEIEKVLRAEISSRLGHGEKMNGNISQIRVEVNDSINYVQEAVSENKRKQELQNETLKKDLVRLLNESLKQLAPQVDLNQFKEVQTKIEEIEDALDEFSKQEERIELNSESIKHIEMENILAQGDIHNVLEDQKKVMVEMQRQNIKNFEDLREELERPKTSCINTLENVDTLKQQYDVFPSQIRLMEKKIEYVAESLQVFKEEHAQDSKANKRAGTPIPNHQDDLKLEEVNDVVVVLRDVLSEIIDTEYEENTEDEQLRALKEKIDKLKEDEEEEQEKEDEGEKDDFDSSSEEEDEENEDEEEEEAAQPDHDGESSGLDGEGESSGLDGEGESSGLDDEGESSGLDDEDEEKDEDQEKKKKAKPEQKKKPEEKKQPAQDDDEWSDDE